MPEVKEYTIYKFEELSDDAKEKARDWWRQCENADFDTEYMYDDFVVIAEALGISFKQRAVKLMGGSTRYDPTIYWSGFSSQGDGACFEGSYAYRKGSIKALEAHIGKETDENKGLYEIARDLLAIQRRAFYKLSAHMKHSGHYYHSGCMDVAVTDDRNPYGDASDDNEHGIKDCMRAFADYIYKTLQAEYWWRMEDEQVDEAIEANEYTFDMRGNRKD